MRRIRKVARMLGAHRTTVIRWIKQGGIKAARLGKGYRIPEEGFRRLFNVCARVSSSGQRSDWELRELNGRLHR